MRKITSNKINIYFFGFNDYYNFIVDKIVNYVEKELIPSDIQIDEAIELIMNYLDSKNIKNVVPSVIYKYMSFTKVN